ncbi:MAG: ABC transporter ATP-binding protein/permease [Desulfurococcales archaeon]|nr:ABC transporter ATP-binding protein/permease [Desulfurococcales archaeon]
MRGKSSLKQLARLFSYVGPDKWAFIIALILVLFSSYANAVVPVLIRDALDLGVSARDWGSALYYGGLIILAGVVGGALSFAARLFQVKAAQNAVYRLRIEAFRAIQRQSMEFFDRTLVGQLISRVTNDAERVTGFLSFRVRMLAYSTTLIIVALYYMARMSGLLTLIALATIAIVLASNIVYAVKVRPVYDRIRRQTGTLAAEATSTLAGIKTVKALAVEEHLYARYDRENRRLMEEALNAARITALYGNLSFLVMGVAMAGMLYFGGPLITEGTLTVGELVAFLTYMLTMMWPLRALGFVIGDIQRALAAATRLFEIIDTAPRHTDPPDAVELREVRGEVQVEDVWFTYPSGKTVLRGVTLHVRPGEKILITGPPGSGKSTLLKLIARLYEPQKGTIKIDGVDIRKIKTESLRRIVAYVPQEPFIFNRSIRENIAIGKPDATPEEIIEAAKRAKIHDFIATLPRGYDTVVGERGVSLSGGQRQRIALARALLAKPKILLLDDPVSNLDAETERRLIEDLGEVLRGRTAIIVSQRLTMARLADRVVVMKDGRIVEMGKPEELAARKGLYREMLKAQGLLEEEVKAGGA